NTKATDDGVQEVIGIGFPLPVEFVVIALRHLAALGESELSRSNVANDKERDAVVRHRGRLVVAIRDFSAELIRRRPAPTLGKVWDASRVRGHRLLVLALPLVVLRCLSRSLEPGEFGFLPAAAAF